MQSAAAFAPAAGLAPGARQCAGLCGTRVGARGARVGARAGRAPARRARALVVAQAGGAAAGREEDEGGVGTGWGDFELEDGEEITEEAAARLRAKLPGPIAEFLLRRARGSPRRDTLVSKLVRDGEPEPPDWDDFVYDSRPAPPGVATAPLYDGIPTEGAVDVPPQSLFVGRAAENEMQARQVGYAALAIVLLIALLRIAGAFLAFVLSFTFSFFAIFALSAAMFVVFLLFRFF